MKRLSWNDQTETLDTLFEGRLKILQKKRGYRFSIDALLLAHFADPGPKDRIIDLGTGCGILPLILLFRRKASRIIGVEIQPSLADLARRNAALNRFTSRIKILEKDWKDFKGKKIRGTFGLVLSNPPYQKVGSGRINPDQEKALARHEINATLGDMLRVAYHLLKDRGRLTMIYPATRAADLIKEMAGFHLEPKRMQFVHSKEKDEARLVLVEALKEGRAQVRILPPFVLYDSEGGYTPGARELFR
jgi:tRNA1Val (adenine37-N6)-methyltransferase